MKKVKKIIIAIEWKKSKLYGRNPHLNANVFFDDGDNEKSKKYTCSGCGYDKESTVISFLFDDYLKEIAQKKVKENIKKPYGISTYENTITFGDAIGMSSYREISKFLGYELKNIISLQNIDVYELTKI